MPHINRYLDHPCVFVHDGEARLGPGDVPDTYWPQPPLIRRTERMIAVGTIAAVDGEVFIRLDVQTPLNGLEIFEGVIATPSGSMSVTQSSGEEILRLSDLPDETMVTIGVDNLRHPSCVHILVARVSR